jgi:hypothetical protein
LISARDMAISSSAAMAATPVAQATPLAERILLIVLFITVLPSSIAFIEPSPHDLLIGLLGLACLVAGVRLERKLAVLVLLLLIWNVAGLMSLLNVADNSQAIQYTATSFYLSVAAIIFASLFSQNSMPRLAAMRTAYIASAVFTAGVAIAGYLHLVPFAVNLLEENGRARGTFKDANVFGPFLIWPALFILTRIVSRGVSLRDIGMFGIILFGLLLSFSRGAWINFTIGGVVTFVLLILTAPNKHARLRIFGFAFAGIVAIAVFVVLLLSIDSVRQMFEIRAQTLQDYDTGEAGRFGHQLLALGALLDNPNGMGPFEFARIYGLQQHNVYLQAFMVYGWVGGFAYLMMVIATITVGFRTVFIATPWQIYLITALSAFTGHVVEGGVIDTDHWRHFFLLMGTVWGLFAASSRYQQNSSTQPMSAPA